MFESRDEMILAISNAVPYGIDSIDTMTDPDAVYFTWREDKFKLSKSGLVLRIEDGCGHGDSLSILMERVIKLEYSKK